MGKGTFPRVFCKITTWAYEFFFQCPAMATLWLMPHCGCMSGPVCVAGPMTCTSVALMRKAHFELSLPGEEVAAPPLDSGAQHSWRLLFSLYKLLKLEKWSQVPGDMGNHTFIFHTSRTSHSRSVVWVPLVIPETLIGGPWRQNYLHHNTKMSLLLLTHSLVNVGWRYQRLHEVWDPNRLMMEAELWIQSFYIKPDAKKIWKKCTTVLFFSLNFLLL